MKIGKMKSWVQIIFWTHGFFCFTGSSYANTMIIADEHLFHCVRADNLE